jgi:hypothetical protein
MRFGGGKNEFDVCGRFLQRFEERIEGRVRQHVDFVDDDDTEATLHRSVLRPLGQVTNIIDSRMRRSIYFQDIKG